MRQGSACHGKTTAYCPHRLRPTAATAQTARSAQGDPTPFGQASRLPKRPSEGARRASLVRLGASGREWPASVAWARAGGSWVQPRWLFWSLPPGVDERDGPSLFLCFSDVWPSASPVAREVPRSQARTREWTDGRMDGSKRGTFGSLPHLPNDLLWPCPATRSRCFCVCIRICICIDICAGIASPALMIPC
jgi:hypothetical protein